MEQGTRVRQQIGVHSRTNRPVYRYGEIRSVVGSYTLWIEFDAYDDESMGVGIWQPAVTHGQAVDTADVEVMESIPATEVRVT